MFAKPGALDQAAALQDWNLPEVFQHLVAFDAVKLIALARIERRPARLDLAAYARLPRTAVKTTSVADYAVLAA